MDSRWPSGRRLDVPEPTRESPGRWLFMVQPRALREPVLPRAFADTFLLIRVPIVIAYQILRLEYALSPGGHLRAAMVLLARVFLLGLVFAFAISPCVIWVLYWGAVFIDALAGFLESVLRVLMMAFGIMAIFALLAVANSLYKGNQ
jgi:hypothetical protein